MNQGGKTYEHIIEVISKPVHMRKEAEIEVLLPWMRKKSPLFNSMKHDILVDIIKNCEFRSMKRNDLVIQQGKKGDCFFVLLRGSISVFINPSLADEEDETKLAQKVHSEHIHDSEGELDRAKLGNMIRGMECGVGFGEVALITKNCIRSASVVADEPIDLMVVNRDLYNRCLKAAQMAEIEAKMKFVKNHQYFRGWQPKLKKQLAYSLTKLRVEYDNYVIKQGSRFTGMYFLIKGQAKITVDPASHPSQYPNQFKTKQQDTDACTRSARFNDENRNRRQRRRKLYDVCLIGPNETIGDIEVSFDMKTFSQSVLCCTGDVELYVLNFRNYEQLIARRNAFTMDIIRRGAMEKLRARVAGPCGRRLVMFKLLLKRLDEPDEPSSSQKKKEPTFAHEEDFLPQLGAIIDMFGPGTVFYRNRMRAIAKERAQARMNFRGVQGLGVKYHMAAPLRRATSVRFDLDTIHEKETHGMPPTFTTQPDGDSDDDMLDFHSAIAFYCDFDSSDRAMRLLEEKIEAFHAAFEMESSEGRKPNSRPPSAVRLKRVHLDHLKGLRPGRKVIVRPRRLSDGAKILGDERLALDARPRSASMCVDRLRRQSRESMSSSKEAPAALHPRLQSNS